jgi:hypothetical protein
MNYGSHTIDDFLTFGARAHTPATSADVDADAVPTYDVYEDETGTPIVSAQDMAKLNDAGSLGLYSERIQLTVAIGYELGKMYHIDVHTVVGGVTSSELHVFQMEAHVDAASISAPQSSAADISDAVWDEAKGDHVAAGSTGLELALMSTATTEPTGVPSATETPTEQLNRIHQALRNRLDVTSTKKTFFDDADGALWEQDLTDNGTTYSQSEGNAV